MLNILSAVVIGILGGMLIIIGLAVGIGMAVRVFEFFFESGNKETNSKEKAELFSEWLKGFRQKKG